MVGNLGVLLSSIQEQRPSPSPAVSEEPLEARQRTFAAFYERDLDPSFSVGIGIARLEYSVTGVLSEEEPPLLAAVSPAAEPKKVAVDIEKDSEISPIATVRFATSSGQLFADGQAMLSQAGVLWMGRVGVEMGSVRAGVGYLSSPGDPPIGGPVAFLGASF